MSEDRLEGAPDQAERQEPREDYVAPALNDLGSFEELTQFNPTGATDSEGSS
jgi:hypothetical protein